MKFTELFKKCRLNIKNEDGHTGVTQTDLANILMVSNATVRNWERGRNFPHRFQFNQLQEIFPAMRKLKYDKIKPKKKQRTF